MRKIECGREPAGQVHVMIGDPDGGDGLSDTRFLTGEHATHSLRRQGAVVVAETHDQKTGRLHRGGRRPVLSSQAHREVCFASNEIVVLSGCGALRFPGRRLLRDPAVQLLNQRALFHRFGDIGTGSDIQRHLAVLVTGPCRHHDNRRLLRLWPAA